MRNRTKQRNVATVRTDANAVHCSGGTLSLTSLGTLLLTQRPGRNLIQKRKDKRNSTKRLREFWYMLVEKIMGVARISPMSTNNKKKNSLQRKYSGK